MDRFTKNMFWIIIFAIIGGALANLEARGYFCGAATWTTCIKG